MMIARRICGIGAARLPHPRQRDPGVDRLERRRVGQRPRDAALDQRASSWVTDLGDWPVVPLLAVPLVIYELRRAPNRYLVPFLLVVFVGDKLVTNGIKDLVDRARPTLNPIAETLGPSFPSGHSSTAASFYAALALILARRRGPSVRALLAGAAGAIAVASRGESRAARRALALRRHRRPPARLGLVRPLRRRVRRSPPALRRAARGRGGRCTSRRPPEDAIAAGSRATKV